MSVRSQREAWMPFGTGMENAGGKTVWNGDDVLMGLMPFKSGARNHLDLEFPWAIAQLPPTG